MRFVFASYVKSPEYSSPEAWLKRLAAYFGVLEALAKHHEVISIEQIDYAGAMKRNGVYYHFADFGKGRTAYFPFRLHRMIRHMDPDFVIIHGTNFPMQVLQLSSLIRKKTKIILQNHNILVPGGFRAVMQRLADRYVDAYFFTSTAVAEDWIAGKLIRSVLKVRELMVGSSIFIEGGRTMARTILGIPPQSRIFLWVGHLNENKDPLTVVKAFIQFSRIRSDIVLYMIYQNDELLDSIRDCIRETHSSSTVRLVGKVAHMEMGDWFNSADYFLSGSRQEVYGAALVESMSCGCIPILTDIPSFRQITDNGSCAFLYRAGDQEDLLRALKVAESNNIDEMREKVRRRYNEKLSFKSIAADISEKCLNL